MILRLSNLRHVTTGALLVALPFASYAQVTTDQLGTLHNEVLGKYFSSGNPMITAANLSTQLPVAVNFVCRELNLKGLSCKGCENQGQGTSVMGQFISDRYASSNASSFFDSRVEQITTRFPINAQERSLVNQLRDIVCGPIPMSTKASMLASLQMQFKNSAAKGAFAEWFGGALSVALGSCTFWGSPNNPSSGNDPVGFLIGDCLGYLAGWVSAVIDDAGNGSLDPAGEERRITQGLWGGIIGSVVGP
jgi:hypothetical protein